LRLDVRSLHRIRNPADRRKPKGELLSLETIALLRVLGRKLVAHLLPGRLEALAASAMSQVLVSSPMVMRIVALFSFP
jgi:hypothetical protein